MNWYYYKGALLSNTEIHNDVTISGKEAGALLKSYKAFFLRYTTGFDQGTISPAYYIIKDSWKGMEELGPRTRTQVRHALKKCDVKIITKELLSSQGYEVYCEHIAGFKNSDNTILSNGQFSEMILNLNDRELFGCFDIQTGKLIGYAQNISGEGVSYSVYKANPRYYKSHLPFYALFYKLNEYYLQECKKKYVCAGFRTLDNHSNIQEFLIERFKFRKAYCKLYIHYVWWLRLLVSLLYPFRRLIKINKISSLLFQEEISRKSIRT